ncbi:hypothetical protein HCEICBPK_02811 [[Clostridium] scindens]|nr:hypothetical protein HCEICBPK_02811 [[Clostridium] scindens]
MGNSSIIQKNKMKIDNYYVKRGNESRKNSFSVLQNAYSAKSAHPFRRNGAPFRLKLSNAQLVN